MILPSFLGSLGTDSIGDGCGEFKVDVRETLTSAVENDGVIAAGQFKGQSFDNVQLFVRRHGISE